MPRIERKRAPVSWCVSWGAACAMLALGACSSERESTAGGERTVQEQDTAPAPSPQPAPPAPAPDAQATGDTGTGIPSAIQGRWGLVPADCTSTRGDAKGLIAVSPRKIEFYESVADLGAVGERKADRMRGTFAFEGEGQQWTMDMLLAIQPDGSLLRRDFGPDAAPEPLRYQRCK